MATQRITFCTFKTGEGFNVDQMVKLLLDGNSSEKQFVFSEQGTAYVRGCFYIEQQYNDIRYNIATGEMEKVIFHKQISLKFEIDLSGQTIMIWGNKNIVASLLTELASCSGNAVVIDEIPIDFKKSINKISQSNNVKVSKVKIANVPIEQGIFATCVVNAQALDSPNVFISKYIENITQISVVLNDDYLGEDETTSITATLYSSGSFIIYKDKDSVSDETIDIIKKIIC